MWYNTKLLGKEDDNVEQKDDIERVLSNVKSHACVQRMKHYSQHGNVSTFTHCESVAKMSYAINRTFRLNSNLDTLLKGAMLHDMFLYDWHAEDDGEHKMHGFHHAKTACENAKRFLDTNSAINHVILCHMWPLNLTRIPKSREAWIVCIADKVVSLKETLFERR